MFAAPSCDIYVLSAHHTLSIAIDNARNTQPISPVRIRSISEIAVDFRHATLPSDTFSCEIWRFVCSR